MRAKMRLEAVIAHNWGSGLKAVFRTAYDQTIPEDVSFCKATPSGHVEMVIDNEKVFPLLVIGKHYYVDFTPVE